MKNQPAYVFKTSSMSAEMGKKLDRVGVHYLKNEKGLTI